MFSCVGIEEYQAPDIERYHCPDCALLHGPLTRKYPYLFCFLQLRIFLKLGALKLLFIDCLGVQIDAKTKPRTKLKSPRELHKAGIECYKVILIQLSMNEIDFWLVVCHGMNEVLTGN